MNTPPSGGVFFFSKGSNKMQHSIRLWMGLVSTFMGVILIAGCVNPGNFSDDKNNDATKPLIDEEKLKDEPYKAAQAIHSLIKPKQRSRVLDLVLSPNVSQDFETSISKDLGKAMDFWSPYSDEVDFKTVVLTELDTKWANKQAQKFGGDLDIDRQIKETEGNCNWAIATRTYGGEPIVYLCTNSSGVKVEDSQTLPHEYFHLVQLSELDNWNNEMPCWILEGSATYFGAAIAFLEKPNIDYTSYSRLFFSRLLDQSPLGRDASVQIIKNGNGKEIVSKVIAPTTATQSSAGLDCAATGAYAVGALITEYLVITYGPEKFVELSLTDFSSNRWKKAFRKIFGVSLNQLYQDSALYISKQIVEE
jgi:hypothetical protein